MSGGKPLIPEYHRIFLVDASSKMNFDQTQPLCYRIIIEVVEKAPHSDEMRNSSVLMRAFVGSGDCHAIKLSKMKKTMRKKAIFAIPIVLLGLMMVTPAVTAQDGQGENAERQEKAYLGIRPGELSEQIQEVLDIEEDSGVVVQQVVDESPASKGGLQKFDILLKADGNKLESVADLRKVLSNKNPGSAISFVVLRDGDRKTVSLKLGSRTGRSSSTEESGDSGTNNQDGAGQEEQGQDEQKTDKQDAEEKEDRTDEELRNKMEKYLKKLRKNRSEDRKKKPGEPEDREGADPEELRKKMKEFLKQEKPERKKEGEDGGGDFGRSPKSFPGIDQMEDYLKDLEKNLRSFRKKLDDQFPEEPALENREEFRKFMKKWREWSQNQTREMEEMMKETLKQFKKLSQNLKDITPPEMPEDSNRSFEEMKKQLRKFWEQFRDDLSRKETEKLENLLQEQKEKESTRGEGKPETEDSKDESDEENEEAASGRPFLGIGLAQTQPDTGVKVGRVIPGTPAAEAGLETGDVIKKFGGDRIGGRQALVQSIRSRNPGDRVKLTVNRNGNEKQFTVTLTSRSEYQRNRQRPRRPGQKDEEEGEEPQNDRSGANKEQGDENDQNAVSSPQEATGHEMPDFKLKEAGSNDYHTLSDYRGQVVIIDVWRTWCGPCRKEIPHFVDLYNEYSDEGLTILGTSDEAEEKVKRFGEKKNVPYPLLLESSGDLPDVLQNVRAYPTTFIIDRKGVVREVVRGYRPKSFFRKKITPLLKEDGESAENDSSGAENDEASRGDANSESAGTENGEPYLGFSPEKNPDGNGLRIADVVSGTPADRAGLKKGDVIKALNGTKITSMKQARRVYGKISPGDQVKLLVERNGWKKEITLKAAARSDYENQKERDRENQNDQTENEDGSTENRENTRAEESNQSGEENEEGQSLSRRERILKQVKKKIKEKLGRDEIPPQILERAKKRLEQQGILPEKEEENDGDTDERESGTKEKQNEDAPESNNSSALNEGDGEEPFIGFKPENDPAGEGLLVTKVVEGSPADRSGLKKGDLVLSINGKRVRNRDEAYEVYQQLSPGDRVTFRVRRGNSEKKVSVNVGARKEFEEKKGDEEKEDDQSGASEPNEEKELSDAENTPFDQALRLAKMVKQGSGDREIHVALVDEDDNILFRYPVDPVEIAKWMEQNIEPIYRQIRRNNNGNVVGAVKKQVKKQVKKVVRNRIKKMAHRRGGWKIKKLKKLCQDHRKREEQIKDRLKNLRSRVKKLEKRMGQSDQNRKRGGESD